MNLKNKGFTLVELLAVIVVVAIIMGIAALSITNFLGNSKDRVYLNYAATLKTTVEDYLIEDSNSLIMKQISLKLISFA